MSVNTDPPYDRLETILMGGTVEPPYSRRELIAMQAGGGGDSGSGAVIITDNGTQLDKTYAEIYDLINSGVPCYICYNAEGSQSDLDDDYTYQVELMPVVAMMKYSATYRLYASAWYYMTVSSGSSYISSVGTPAIWTYQVSDSTGYPTFLRRAYVATASMTSSPVRT